MNHLLKMNESCKNHRKINHVQELHVKINESVYRITYEKLIVWKNQMCEMNCMKELDVKIIDSMFIYSISITWNANRMKESHVEMNESWERITCESWIKWNDHVKVNESWERITWKWIVWRNHKWKWMNCVKESHGKIMNCERIKCENKWILWKNCMKNELWK